MAVYKLNIDEFDEIDYQLIAIHTSLEDYRLAFFINQHFPVLLAKNEKDIPITAKSGSTTLSRFSFEDEYTCSTWDLIQNQSEIVSQTSTNDSDLFGRANVKVASKAFLLPEFKKVDYLLKLQNMDDSAEDICDKLQQIDQITMSYTLDTNRIKSINNLIF
ncbi:IPExxxVDY family protein [Flavobacterium sp. MAH-1]|uniref:IPExxxVDY family protein n=1 Tax=Flavobacterium agri TaxID=2743471 RepID=A0A7Y9C7G6_9FLAO|nr:IPExxxVDY family protein [Flavobacterium agri]NUY81318.1 IPExxxVDY family protein [Flavobacterium agri]NYA71342.1 IPExxxVDY family protein [Flavobacterium agri]